MTTDREEPEGTMILLQFSDYEEGEPEYDSTTTLLYMCPLWIQSASISGRAKLLEHFAIFQRRL